MQKFIQDFQQSKAWISSRLAASAEPDKVQFVSKN